MNFKSILVPVGEKINRETGEKYFCCPRTKQIFGELKRGEIRPHLRDKLECTCLKILSKEKGAKLALEFERSQGLHSICAIGVSYQNPSHLEKTKKITDRYTLNYENGKKKKIPTNLNAPMIYKKIK